MIRNHVGAITGSFGHDHPLRPKRDEDAEADGDEGVDPENCHSPRAMRNP